MSQKPVIFLAFANVRDGSVAYLRNLPEEQRRIRDALERARAAGLCEVVERPNATTKDILKNLDPKAEAQKLAAEGQLKK
jgi:hypothetical protein